MSTQIAQKIKQDTHEKLEELRERSVERARENFTRLPGFLVEQVFGIAQSKEDHSKAKNFTPFDEKTRDKMGETFNKQDAPKMDATRTELESLKTQMDFMRREEIDAQEYFKKKEEERKKTELEDEENRAMEEARKAQAAFGSSEPTTKAQRGTEKRKQPTETVENRASVGKQ